MERVILHCDLNSFYASVELLEHPELREKPVAVCGNPSTRHGIILAKNEAAKRFQVKTAETAWRTEPYFPAERGMRGGVLPMRHAGTKSPTPLSTVCKPSAPACGMPRRRRRNRAQRR